MKLTVFSFVIALVTNFYKNEQNRIISGKVIGVELGNVKENIEHKFWELPEAKILCNDSVSMRTTNEHGEFLIEIPSDLDEIKVGWIVMDWEKIPITDQCDYLEIVLIPNVIYDFVSAKKAARLREKERKILPELYIEAFKQGLFKQEKPCR